ncbi:MAG: hypothetical protein R3C01_08705 [Planctomycetaceae bacterium]
MYLNDINHSTGVRLGELVAESLWQNCRPRRVDDHSRTKTVTSRKVEGPTVVIGCDTRPSSPDILTGVAIGLRRMGCQVVDVGRVSRPVFDFTVRDLDAHGGILVTGSGLPVAWTGADVVGFAAEPWAKQGLWKQLVDRWEKVSSRPTRHGGSLVSYPPDGAYFGSLMKHFRNCRRLVVGVGFENRSLQNSFVEFARELPVTFVPMDPVALRRKLPRKGLEWTEVDGRSQMKSPRQHSGEGLVDAALSPQEVSDSTPEITCLIDESARCCTLWDEHGNLVHPTDWLVRLVEWMLPRSLHRQIVVPPQFPASARGRLRAYGAELVSTNGTEAEMFHQLRERHCLLGADGEGRLWLPENDSRCDALATLARLIELLSQTTRPPSFWST